jgi:hypothetical protein
MKKLFFTLLLSLSNFNIAQARSNAPPIGIDPDIGPGPNHTWRGYIDYRFHYIDSNGNHHYIIRRANVSDTVRTRCVEKYEIIVTSVGLGNIEGFQHCY